MRAPWLIRTTIYLLAVAAAVGCGLSWLYDMPGFDVALILGAAVIFTLATIGLTSLFSRGPGPLKVSVEHATVGLSDELSVGFDELGLPRLVLYHATSHSDGEEQVFEAPAIVMSRRQAPDLVLFDHRVPSWVLRQLPTLAEYFNTLFAEYHQREAVRAWLRRREAEIEAGRPYRRGSGASRGDR